MPYAVVARYRCEPGDAELVRGALLEMRAHTLREPGNLLYIVHADTSDSAAFTLYEQYVDRAAFDAHTQAPHFAEHILGTVRPRLVERSVSFGEVL
ncbi:putative quinol monooxygenase [Actinomadura parmotrematis]|uniref:Antibiotic biosynthesis monooxygenase n=1 Tax=Actinomadura parmotrematis TaxID=2864039 RepID=A0ABS7FMJ6_9ACTN|nr:putative quinol monooxygenase [Actinomadura parmotrematis]MBW8481215.1 antibiotic biosynthesis monooxygenase [Actinomadura parmotrematis]